MLSLRAGMCVEPVSLHSQSALHGEKLTALKRGFVCYFLWAFQCYFVKAVYHEAGCGGVFFLAGLHVAFSAG